MIARNTAGQPILIGPLLAKTDGADQTSGAAIAVRKDGVDVGAAGGTLTHAGSGIWQYTPTQAETDCRMIGLILSKSGASSVATNVPTTRVPYQTSGVLPAVEAGAEGGLDLSGSDEISGWTPGPRTFKVIAPYLWIHPAGTILTEADLGPGADLDRLVSHGSVQEIA
jgi:hypothetical protein